MAAIIYPAWRFMRIMPMISRQMSAILRSCPKRIFCNMILLSIPSLGHVKNFLTFQVWAKPNRLGKPVKQLSQAVLPCTCLKIMRSLCQPSKWLAFASRAWSSAAAVAKNFLALSPSSKPSWLGEPARSLDQLDWPAIGRPNLLAQPLGRNL